jgi:hypothetical protein
MKHIIDVIKQKNLDLQQKEKEMDKIRADLSALMLSAQLLLEPGETATIPEIPKKGFV